MQYQRLQQVVTQMQTQQQPVATPTASLTSAPSTPKQETPKVECSNTKLTNKYPEK